MISKIIIICLITFLGAFIQASTGFGFAIVAMATIPLLLTMTDSIMLLLFCSVVTIGYLAIKNIRYVNYKQLILPLIFSLAGNYIGLTVLVNMGNELAIKLLGGLMILLSIYFFFFADKIRLPINQLSASTAGVISGLLGGFFNIPGPPMVLYYSVAIKQKKEYFSTLQMLFFINTVFKLGYLLIFNRISDYILPIIPYAVVFSIIGMIIGFALFKHLSTKSVKRIVYLLMACSGIWFIVS